VRLTASPGPVRRSKGVRITKGQWESFLTALDEAQFWELDAEGGTMVCDGTTWVLEGMRHGHYHVVTRWTPEAMAEAVTFRAACTLLLGLSKINADH
jgi:hypothetical protein